MENASSWLGALLLYPAAGLDGAIAAIALGAAAALALGLASTRAGAARRARRRALPAGALRFAAPAGRRAAR